MRPFRLPNQISLRYQSEGTFMNSGWQINCSRPLLALTLALAPLNIVLLGNLKIVGIDLE